jgi:serine protease Do
VNETFDPDPAGRAPRPALAEATAALAGRLRRVLVAIRSQAGGGSGTVWASDGLIVTNSHVVAGDRAEVLTHDGRELPARLAGRDAEHDLALLRIEAAGLETATPGDARALRPGELVFAAGNPWGQRGVVTAGIVASLGPAGPEDGVPLEEAIRADVRLAPGNSGGPLANARGEVVGINSMISGGMAIAVPVHAVASLVQAPGGGFLGIAGRAVPLPSAVAAAYGADDGAGLLITGITDGSPAEHAGLLAGDIVVRLDGLTGGLRTLARQLRALTPGAPLRLELLRGGRRHTVIASPVARL